MEMQDYIKKFSEQVECDVDIYNEFSLQHELGIFLRKVFKTQNTESTKIQFERNISFFGLKKEDDKSKEKLFEKSEMDICIFKPPRDWKGEPINLHKTPSTVIELKFPRNGKYPEEMFSFCEDIRFLEQLLEAGFNKAYLVIFVNDKYFYSGKCVGRNGNKIYSYFRIGCEKPLTGCIQKPTGKTDKKLQIKGIYQVKWHHIYKDFKYALIEANIRK